MIKHMTESEKQVMDLLWKSEVPLSCDEIVRLSTDKTWKDSYVHSLMKSLTKKGIAQIVSFELTTRSYARKFAPKISYDEYVLLSSFSEDEIKDTDRMARFIRIVADHSESDKLLASIYGTLSR